MFITAPIALSHISIPRHEEQPKVIYFDFGGVVAEPDPQVQIDFLVDRVGFSLESLQSSPYFKWMQLHPSEIDFLSKIAEEHKVDLSPELIEEYRQVKRGSVREISGMSQLISDLRHRNYEVNLITNIRSENLDLIEPFIPLFDHVVHCPKDPGQRRAAWEVEWGGLDASRFMLIDDQAINVEEAQKLGMQTIHFQNVETLLAELTRRGLVI